MNKKFDHQFYILYFKVWSPHFGTNPTPVITTSKQSPESNHDVRLPPIPGCPQISLDLDTTVTVYYHTDLTWYVYFLHLVKTDEFSTNNEVSDTKL